MICTHLGRRRASIEISQPAGPSMVEEGYRTRHHQVRRGVVLPKQPKNVVAADENLTRKKQKH